MVSPPTTQGAETEPLFPSLPLSRSRPANTAIESIRRGLAEMPDATYPRIQATRRQWADLLRWLSS